MAGEDAEDLDLFAELFSFLSSGFRYFYHDERIHFIGVAVGSPTQPRQIFKATFEVHNITPMILS
jgi:hypothetical protein